MPVRYSLSDLEGRHAVEEMRTDGTPAQAHLDRGWAITELRRAYLTNGELQAENERLHGLVRDLARQVAEHVREEE